MSTLDTYQHAPTLALYLSPSKAFTILHNGFKNMIMVGLGTYNSHSSKAKGNAIIILVLERMKSVRHKCSLIIMAKDQTHGLLIGFMF